MLGALVRTLTMRKRIVDPRRARRSRDPDVALLLPQAAADPSTVPFPCPLHSSAFLGSGCKARFVVKC